MSQRFSGEAKPPPAVTPAPRLMCRANSQLRSFTPLRAEEKLVAKLRLRAKKLSCAQIYVENILSGSQIHVERSSCDRDRVPHILSLKQCCRHPSILGLEWIRGIPDPAPPRDARTSSRREDSGSRICTMWWLARRWTIAWSAMPCGMRSKPAHVYSMLWKPSAATSGQHSPGLDLWIRSFTSSHLLLLRLGRLHIMTES